MIRPLLFLAIGGSAFAIASYVSPQGDQPAEKVFKNVQSFRGVTAKDMLASMFFMSESLGVRCNFCHDPNNYSLDTQEHKVIARRMISMQKEINRCFFDGRTRVSCMTCHQGKSEPPSSPAIRDHVTERIATGEAVEPAQIVAKARSTMGAGGPKCLRRARSTWPG